MNILAEIQIAAKFRKNTAEIQDRGQVEPVPSLILKVFWKKHPLDIFSMLKMNILATHFEKFG